MGSVAGPWAPAAQRDVISRINSPIKKSLKTVMPRDAYPAVGILGFLDHSPCNQDSVDNDVVLSHREHAADRQEPGGVDAHPMR